MDNKVIANIKSIGLDMINEAGSGHPGILLGATPIMYALFKNNINIYSEDSNWLNRDRFVLSAGHGSAMLYSTYFMSSLGLSIEDLKKFRQIDSKTPGHPEFGITDFVETTTGPLGQGVANGVGMAIASKMLNSKYKLEDGTSLFDYNVYVLVGDGDLMEGVAQEALSLAGSLKLDNLVVLYDSNNITLDGGLSNSNTENAIEKMQSMGFYTSLIDGENIDDISSSIKDASAQKLPSFIECKTIIGKDSIKEDTNQVHGKPLEENDIALVKKKLKITNDPFYVDEEAKKYFTDCVYKRSLEKYNLFNERLDNYLKSNENIFNDKKLNMDEFTKNIIDELRGLNNVVLDEVSNIDDTLISLSADLSSSTKTYLTGKGDFSKNDRLGRNVWCGVREHSMGGIANGLALSGFTPVTSTFLSFADYMKPAIRLSALMNLKVLYTFTHDSIAIGADGPTHQPVEQLAMLRAIPNLDVYRPANLEEIKGCYESFYKNDRPAVLVISKDKVGLIDKTSSKEVSKGAYIVKEYKNQMHGIIISTGDDLHVALKVSERLFNEEKLDFRVVSMPSMCLFLRQDNNYINSILPKGVRVTVVEKSSSFGWHRFVLNDDYLVTINEFGHSGSKNDTLLKMGMDEDSIFHKIKDIYK